MNKKRQLQRLMNPKTVSYMIGGALISYFLFQNLIAAIIGAIMGVVISFIK